MKRTTVFLDALNEVVIVVGNVSHTFTNVDGIPTLVNSQVISENKNELNREL